MVLWFAGMSVLLVWTVFRDPAIDYRLVVVGALAPDLIDALTGGTWAAHSVLFSVVLLLAVMLGTRHRRALRRRLLALPIGTFLHLVLDGAWADTDAFWWPLTGWSFGDTPIPSLDRGWVNLVLEVIGAAALVWCWFRFGLDDRERRRVLWCTGRLDRSLVGPPTPPSSC